MKRTLRGRGVSLGLVVFLTACGVAGPGPVAEAGLGVSAPVRETVGDGVRVSNSAAREALTIYGDPAGYRATLLFLEGRAATPSPGGGSAWADLDGGRVVTFDDRGLVESVLGGAPPGGGPLTQPGFVVLDGEDVLAVELDGRALRFVGSEPTRWESGPTPWGGVGGSGVVAASRTVFDIQIAPLAADDPLVWVADGTGRRGVGRLRMPEQAMLAPVVNSGWVAATERGDVYFASAVRPELHRYDATGALRWIATWPHGGAYEPAFAVTAGTLTPKFRLAQQALAVGPDGLAYVLATTGDEGPADRLLVFDRDGTLLRSAHVDPFAAIYAGPEGHVFSVPAAHALARTPATASMAFEPFTLPALDGVGSVSLEAHAGKVVVLNFWASWCAPCRREMPLLGALAASLPQDEVAFIGLNEDQRPADALAFLREIGDVGYPHAKGEGRLRERYGYRGLPYTVLLGPEGRVLKVFYGFGASIAPIEDAVRQALAQRP